MKNEKKRIYYYNVRDDLISLIPSETKRILEVGCAGGMTGKALREKGCTEIVGIEISEEVARAGEAYYDKLIIGDVEKIKLPFKRGHFDCILYGDVLEHLVDPWKVLKEHHAFLKKDGTIICSIPNVRHYRIIKQLVFKGKWEYTTRGVMDRTHLRFFTLKSIQGMLEEAGFEIRRLIKRPSGAKWLKWCNRFLGNIFIDFLVWQYTVIAVRQEKTRSLR
jgi:2-polyprenyl-3-methyl-5-hydroxy-6-metoxy-1,4-benzoquinol methylase